MSSPPPGYVELRAASAYSFLRAASMPEDLIARAAELGYPSLGLVDRDGLYGAPRFHRAARSRGVTPLVGADVPLDDGSFLTLLVESRPGYRNLCRLVTRGKLRAPKGEGHVTLDEVEEHRAGLVVLEGQLASGTGRAVIRGDEAAARLRLDRLASLFPGALYLEVSRHGVLAEEWRNQILLDLAERRGLPVVATGQVLHARPEDRELLDVLHAIRLGSTLEALGRRLVQNHAYHLRPPEEMARMWSDRPEAAAATLEVAARCRFTLADLGYRFPEFPLEPGETPDGRLRALASAGARERFGEDRGGTRVAAMLEHELGVIARLGLAGYFLVVWDLVRFCRESGIMVQGRGSAANSALCYCLGITAVDPTRVRLLFERFLSEERGEWPDIDLDLPSGDQRERVIRYAYRRYGTRGAALVAVVITYRDKSASREVGKVLGFPTAVLDRLSKVASRGGLSSSPHQDDRLRTAGLDPGHPRVRLFVRLMHRIQDLPRHLGQHPGGMILAGCPLDEVVPLENAAMEGRVVVQWDKDDCEDLGLLKVDLLGLGMMALLERSVPLVRRHYGAELDLARLPVDDPQVFDMLCAADTIGVFQVESRAQMATLPRMRPRCLYDLVVEVAIIRPGPVQGNMVNPYLERRAGRQEVVYPHECLRPVLEKTLGVALFQEQLLEMAMVAAGFTGGKAEELRRAFSKKRSEAAMAALEGALREGMRTRGIGNEAQDQIVAAISSFAHYGFPESHAASFALLVYASAYLKRHYPAAFYASLLDEWPMGFYHPATIVKDAQRHGIEVRPVDVAASDWTCTLEPDLGLRIGLRYVRGLRREAAERLVEERSRAPFVDVHDLRRRAALRDDEARALARLGALSGLGESRRSALWQVTRSDPMAGPLWRSLAAPEEPSPLPEMTPAEETVADLMTSDMTTGPHPMAYERGRLAARGVLTAEAVARTRHGTRVRVAGLVIVRQRPATRTGVVFVSLEDETGIANVMVPGPLFEAKRTLISTSPCMVFEGRLEKRDGVHMVKADRLHRLRSRLARVVSHDWS